MQCSAAPVAGLVMGLAEQLPHTPKSRPALHHSIPTKTKRHCPGWGECEEQLVFHLTAPCQWLGGACHKHTSDPVIDGWGVVPVEQAASRAGRAGSQPPSPVTLRSTTGCSRAGPRTSAGKAAACMRTSAGHLPHATPFRSRGGLRIKLIQCDASVPARRRQEPPLGAAKRHGARLLAMVLLACT